MKKYLLPQSWITFAHYVRRLSGLFLIFFLPLGTYWSFYLAPVDVTQGEIYRLIYIHVPAAFLSLGVYVAMGVLAFIFLTWRIKFCDFVCRAVSPIGLILCAVALITGSLWGKPTWGTYWIWDARLTSQLVLLIFYSIFYFLIQNQGQVNLVGTYVLLLFGLVDVPIIHYSVNWWHTLHQGTTVFASHQAIDSSMLYPLLLMIANGVCLVLFFGSIRFLKMVKK
jgi:heme exporter protein C